MKIKSWCAAQGRASRLWALERPHGERHSGMLAMAEHANVVANKTLENCPSQYPGVPAGRGESRESVGGGSEDPPVRSRADEANRGTMVFARREQGPASHLARGE